MAEDNPHFKPLTGTNGPKQPKSKSRKRSKGSKSSSASPTTGPANQLTWALLLHPHATVFWLLMLVPQALLLGSVYGKDPSFPLQDVMRDVVQSTFHAPAGWVFFLVAVFSLERWQYAWVWTHAPAWASACQKMGWRPVSVLSKCLLVHKTLQAFAVLYVHYFWSPFSLPLASSPNFAWRAMTALQLLLAGQVFNLSVYQAIGAAGVYYGCRLGEPIPWYEGFPFTAIGHPQYRGALMSLVAVLLIGCNQSHVLDGAWWFVWAMGALYQITSVVEDRL